MTIGTVTHTYTKSQSTTKTIPRWNVVLLNDDDHSYDYVIVMLFAVFGIQPEQGMQHAKEVDGSGRSIVLTTSREHGELKQEQVHAFGPDPFIPRCKGSMSCVLEPV